MPMSPEEAMKIIGEQIKAQALQRTSDGRLAQVNERKNPLMRLFGNKTRLDPLVDQTNYLQTLQGALGPEQTQKLLPSGLSVTPEGEAFVDRSVYDNVMQASSKGADAGLNDPNIGELGSAFFAGAGSPAQKAAWDKLDPKTKAALIKIIPGMRTQRQDAFKLQGVDEAGTQIYTNVNEPGYFDAEGKPVKIKGRLIKATAPDVGEKAVADLAALETEKAQFTYASELYKPEYVGPIKGSVQQAIEQYIGTDDERAAFYSTTQNALINRLKRISGGAVTPEEAARFTKAFFNVNKSPTAFQAALNFYINSNDTEAYNYAKLLIKSGRANVPARGGDAPSMSKDNFKNTNAVSTASDYMNKFKKGKK